MNAHEHLCYVCDGRIMGESIPPSNEGVPEVLYRCRDCAPGSLTWAQRFPDTLRGSELLKSREG